MGIVGAVVMLHWARGLCRGAGRRLLDMAPAGDDERTARSTLESIDDVRVADLHVGELGPGRRACVASIVTAEPRDVLQYRDALFGKLTLAHLTVEVHRCPGEHPTRRSPAACS